MANPDNLKGPAQKPITLQQVLERLNTLPPDQQFARLQWGVASGVIPEEVALTFVDGGLPGALVHTGLLQDGTAILELALGDLSDEQAVEAAMGLRGKPGPRT